MPPTRGARRGPRVHSYVSLIKADGILQRVKECREQWRELTELHGPEPAALTCMLEAEATANVTMSALFRYIQIQIFL